MKYIITGDPIAWARAGLSGKRFYDKQKHIKFAIGVMLRNQHGSLPFYEGPLQMEATFYMPIPLKVKNREAWEGKPTRSKPDTSNLVKLIEDASKGILLEDDALIYKISAERVYGMVPRTEFRLIEVGK